jgi:NitT/TauT family transport system permease protein
MTDVATRAPEPQQQQSASSRWLQSSSRARFFILFFLVTVAVWQVLCKATGVRPYIFPAPTDVFRELVTGSSFLVWHTLYTMAATLVGFIISVILGIILSIGIVYSRLLDRTLFTSLVATNAVPKVAVAPLFILWIGIGIESKIVIAVLVSIFPMVVDSVVGLRSVDPGLLDLARAYRGSMIQTFWKIRLPNALPSIFAGMKVAISLSLVGTIVGEFVGSNWGLGFVILQSQGQYNTARVFAAILILAVLGTLLFQAIDWVERRVIPWHVSHRNRHDHS